MSMFQCRLTRTQRSVFFVRVHFTMFKVQTPTELTHECSEMLLRQQFFVDGSLALAFNWVNGCFSIVWSQGNLRGYNCCLALPSSQLCGSYDSIMSSVSLVSLDDYHITHLQCRVYRSASADAGLNAHRYCLTPSLRCFACLWRSGSSTGGWWSLVGSWVARTAMQLVWELDVVRHPRRNWGAGCWGPPLCPGSLLVALSRSDSCCQ